MRAPTVSVVFPCYNYARYVWASVESVLCQTLYPESLEAIVVNDASSDKSWDVIRSFEGDARVRRRRT